MRFKLNEVEGKVKYIAKQRWGNVGSDTSIDTANWMLKHGPVTKSDEFPGYPIAVMVGGTEYHFAGEWPLGGDKDILGDEPKKRKRKE